MVCGGCFTFVAIEKMQIMVEVSMLKLLSSIRKKKHSYYSKDHNLGNANICATICTNKIGVAQCAAPTRNMNEFDHIVWLARSLASWPDPLLASWLDPLLASWLASRSSQSVGWRKGGQLRSLWRTSSAKGFSFVVLLFQNLF